MAFSVAKLGKFKSFEKAQGFFIENTPSTGDSFSVTYVKLNDARDPSELDKLIELNPGFSAIYIVVDGVVSFRFYEGDSTTSAVLSKREYITVTPGTKYEIKGTGELALICLPAFSDKMFSHTDK